MHCIQRLLLDARIVLITGVGKSVTFILASSIYSRYVFIGVLAVAAIQEDILQRAFSA